MTLRPVILLFQPQQSGIGPDFPVAKLQAQGFNVLSSPDVLELYGNVQSHIVRTDARPLVILAGQQADNCLAAAYLRTLYPGVGILALVASNSETALLQALQSGADNYCRRGASFELLLATLLRLLRRMGCSVASASAESGWVLLDRGWVLAGPQEQRIALTTGERAFLVALFAQPGLRAGHRQLSDAVGASYTQLASPDKQVRLGLLVSRLRRKCRLHGTELPLKSLHRWGYMFTGPVL